MYTHTEKHIFIYMYETICYNILTGWQDYGWF